jgi:hypothetical protein
MASEIEFPFVCNMHALSPEQRPQHIATAQTLFQARQQIQELPDGYAFQLANHADVLVRAAEFIALERLCCPFFSFTLKVEPEGGAVWFYLTGREGVKPFIRAELSEFLGETAAVWGQAESSI